MVATGFVDTMMAGHFSKEALAGAAVGSSICFPFLIALNGVMMAATPITAQLAGAGRQQDAGPVIRQGLWLGILLSAVLFAGVRHVDPILEMMALSAEVAAVVKGYLEGISFGFPAAAGYFVLKSFAEGIGKTRPQMVIAVIAIAFNYFANDILINGKYGFPPLGGAGCGWASGITFWLFLFCIAGYILSSGACRRAGIFSRFSLPSARGMAQILRLGLPIGGTIFMECSIFACITLFLGVLGPVVVGGHQIALNYSGIVFSVPLSIGMALTIRSGHAIGRKDPEAARFSCVTGLFLAMGLSLVTLSFTYLFPELIVSVYTKDPEISHVAAQLLLFGALYQFSDAVMTTSQGALRGYKDADVTFFLTFTAYWVITLPLGYTLAMTNMIVPAMGAKGFWLSLIVGLTLSGILLWLRLDRVSKKHIAPKV